MIHIVVALFCFFAAGLTGYLWYNTSMFWKTPAPKWYIAIASFSITIEILLGIFNLGVFFKG